MTPEHTALVERLEGWGAPIGIEAADAIRALAGEVERLKLHYKGVPHDWVAESIYDDVVAERDTLRAEVAALKAQQGVAFLSPVPNHCSRCNAEIKGVSFALTNALGVWCSDYCRTNRDAALADKRGETASYIPQVGGWVR